MSNKLCESNFNQTGKNSFICNNNINPINMKDELKLKKQDIKTDYKPNLYKQDIERYENYENLENIPQESKNIVKPLKPFIIDDIIDSFGLLLLILIILYILARFKYI